MSSAGRAGEASAAEVWIERGSSVLYTATCRLRKEGRLPECESVLVFCFLSKFTVPVSCQVASLSTVNNVCKIACIAEGGEALFAENEIPIG